MSGEQIMFLNFGIIFFGVMFCVFIFNEMNRYRSFVQVMKHELANSDKRPNITESLTAFNNSRFWDYNFVKMIVYHTS